MMKMRVVLVLAVLVLGWGGARVSADTIWTKSGDILKCRVAEETKDQVRIKMAYGGLTIPREEITRHERTTYVVVLKNDTKQEGRIVAESDKELTVELADRTIVVASAEVKSISEKKPEPPPPPPPAKPTPQQIFAIHQRAMDLFRKKEYQKSIDEYSQALKADPEDMLALYNTACAYSLLKDKAKAIEFVKKSLEAGWVNFPHMEQDTDLDNIRTEDGYKELVKDKAEYVLKSTDKMVSRLTKSLEQRGVDARKYKSVYDRDHNFIYLHTKTDEELAVIRKSLEEYAEYQWKHLLQNKPQLPLYIVLLTAADTPKVFPGGVGGVFNSASNTLFCGDMPGFKLMKTSVVIHEFTHALHFADMNARRQEHPIWLIEGLATLFEAADRNGEIVPRHSYRLSVVQNAIRRNAAIPWKTLMEMNHPQFMANAQLAYAQSRYLLFYMQERGLLKKFYDEYTDNAHYANDKTAGESFETVFGKPLESVEREWKQWVLKQAEPPLPFFGVQTQDKDGRAVVTEVVPGSGAAQAGIQKGDVIEKIDDVTIKTSSSLVDAVSNHNPGDEIAVEILRKDGQMAVKAKLGKRGGTVPPPPVVGPPYLGVAVEQKGDAISVKEVDKGSPAEKAGLVVGTLVTEFGGKKVASVRDFLTELKKTKPGQTVKIKTKKGSAESTVSVVIGEPPGK